MNPFVVTTTFMYLGASIWYLWNGQSLLAGTFFGYMIANLFLIFIK
jgi:hypothetical protein